MLTYGDRDALAVYIAALTAGIRVPQDLSLMAVHEAAVVAGTLVIDTMVIPWRQLCIQAVDMLLKKIANPQLPLPAITLPAIHRVSDTVHRLT